MKASSPGLIEYLRSSSRVRFLFNKRAIPRRLVIVFDAFAIFATFILAYCLRYSFNLGAINLEVVMKQSLLVILVYLAFEAIFRSFAGLSKHTIFQNISGVLISTTFSVAILLLISFLGQELRWLQNWGFIPKSILIIHYFLAIVILSLIRLVCRAEA